MLFAVTMVVLAQVVPEGERAAGYAGGAAVIAMIGATITTVAACVTRWIDVKHSKELALLTVRVDTCERDRAELRIAQTALNMELGLLRRRVEDRSDKARIAPNDPESV